MSNASFNGKRLRSARLGERMSLNVSAILRELYDAETESRLDDAGGGVLFDPLVLAVADAGAPWFPRLKEILGPFHRTPAEAIQQVEPVPRARSILCWCLRMSRGTCGACIQRCPVGSIGETVRERRIPPCFEQREMLMRVGPERYAHEGRYGCGLCQTAVPCEFRNPTEKP